MRRCYGAVEEEKTRGCHHHRHVVDASGTWLRLAKEGLRRQRRSMHTSLKKKQNTSIEAEKKEHCRKNNNTHTQSSKWRNAVQCPRYRARSTLSEALRPKPLSGRCCPFALSPAPPASLLSRLYIRSRVPRRQRKVGAVRAEETMYLTSSSTSSPSPPSTSLPQTRPFRSSPQSPRCRPPLPTIPV